MTMSKASEFYVFICNVIVISLSKGVTVIHRISCNNTSINIASGLLPCTIYIDLLSKVNAEVEIEAGNATQCIRCRLYLEGLRNLLISTNCLLSMYFICNQLTYFYRIKLY